MPAEPSGNAGQWDGVGAERSLRSHRPLPVGAVWVPSTVPGAVMRRASPLAEAYLTDLPQLEKATPATQLWTSGPEPR